jgi:2-polyprenyl-6-methoxyphenol hydroxylase-like FAD-dependent oxidoreductase
VVTDVIARAGRVTGVRAIAAGGRPVEVGADLVVGADGVSSRVAQLVGAPIDRKGRHASVTTYAYWSDLAVDGYEFIFLPRLRAGLIPTNDGEVLAFASGPSAAIGAGGLGLIVDAISEASTDLGRRLRRAPAPRGLRTTAALRGTVRRSTGSGWALVGDAGFFKDPTAAHGLGDELRDAELLAAAIGAADRPWDGAALARFEATRNRAGLPLFEVVDRIAGHEWDSTEIAHLVMELNSAMAAEVDALAALEEIA